MVDKREKPEMKCTMLEEKDDPIGNKSLSQCMLGVPVQFKKSILLSFFSFFCATERVTLINCFSSPQGKNNE